MSRYLLGLDIGGTKTEVLIVDQSLKIHGRVKQPTVTANSDLFLANVIATTESALVQARVSSEAISAIGIGIPGRVNPQTGTVDLAVNLGPNGYSLGRVLAEKYHVPVRANNDMHLAALGAFHYLNKQRPLFHMAYLGIGTGLAVGLILNGKLHVGAQQMAGEIGHIIIKEDGPVCNCGQQGCLEVMASGPAIVRQAKQLLPTSDVASPRDVYQLAARGNMIATALIQRISAYWARTIQLIIMTCDVERIVIGGGVSQLGDLFLEPILRELSKLRGRSPLASEMLTDAKLMLLPPSFNAGAWGAIHLAKQAISD